ncbi:MAG TPA: tRNA (adenosine(37)-N6)-dimethylallyltransferase MiaA [Acetobacteraceae bacterium]|nr:tRNA (adenosine(37)-N6)-dimethylallyltransferase MiaA [Acetobacteraceae bacterium]
MKDRPAVIVAGPTASGKSALALALAQRLDGTIINADSMQVYRELRVLTARPTVGEEALVPHALYGVRGAAEPGSVAWWTKAAEQAMVDARAAGRRPILCGGTGLYFAALLGGLADIPDPGAAARGEARALLAELGPGGLHDRLVAVDPTTAARIRPADSQRIARAWEVWRGTGIGLADWQARQPAAVENRGHVAIRLDPPRPVLREAIASRFAAMLAYGALEEVRRLLALGLDPVLPAMRAHGVPELSRHLRGQITLTEAAGRAILATGRYTRRQATWFRHHPLAPEARTHTIYARFAGQTQFLERNLGEIVDFVCRLG